MRTTSTAAPTLALIGCGAVASAFYLPALTKHRGWLPRLVLVDDDLDRARALAAAFGVEHVAGSHREVPESVRGAVIAVPNALHYSVALDCLRAGRHVLCEKPLAEREVQARAMVDEAARAGVTLAVNHVRRAYPSCRHVQSLIRGGRLGELTRIEVSWGERFDWKATTGSYFGAAAAGRGVLADRGAHVLDLLCWWLGERPELVSYADDSLGGSEAVARVQLRHRACLIEVALSWLTAFDNIVRIEGTEATLTMGIYDWRSFSVANRGGGETETLTAPVGPLRDPRQLVIDDFLEVLGSGRPPLVPASEVVPSIALIEQCYSRRQRLPMPWFDTLHRLPL